MTVELWEMVADTRKEFQAAVRYMVYDVEEGEVIEWLEDEKDAKELFDRISTQTEEDVDTNS